MDTFSLVPKKRSNAIPWFEYGMGNQSADGELCASGFISKALREKKTYRQYDTSTDLTLEAITKLLVEDEGFYMSYVYSSAEQDIVTNDRYDGPTAVGDDEDHTYKAIYTNIEGDTFVYYVSAKGYTDLKTYIQISSTNLEVLEHLKEKLKEFRTALTKKEEGYVYMMLADNESIKIRKTGKISSSFTKEYYSKDVQHSFEFITKEFRNQIPKGKITILSGPPGTGKTYFIRSLISACGHDCTFVVVPPALITKLGQPEMLPALLEHKSEKRPMVLILEDADILIKERMKDSIDAISAALNMGDGILGDVCNIRLVITTNQPVTEIDEAMKRPGRLSTSCVVGSLGKEEIEIAWKKLSGDKEMPFSLKGRDSASIAEVFQFNVEE